MVTKDFKKLKIGLEGLAVKDKLSKDHSKVLEDCTTNRENNVLMDVSDYTEKEVNNIVRGIDLEIDKEDETLIIKGNF